MTELAVSISSMTTSGWIPAEDDGSTETEPFLVVQAFMAALQDESGTPADLADLVTPEFLAATNLFAMREELLPLRATLRRPKPLSGTWVEVDIFVPPSGIEGDWWVQGPQPYIEKAAGCYLRKDQDGWKIALIGEIGLELSDLPD